MEVIRGYDWLDLSHLFSDEVSGSGWEELLQRLLVDIDGIIAGSSTTLRLLQVKEKFGVLRFYNRLAGATPAVEEQIREAIRRAEIASRQTCFKCGSSALMRRHGGWIIPLCDDHAASLQP